MCVNLSFKVASLESAYQCGLLECGNQAKYFIMVYNPGSALRVQVDFAKLQQDAQQHGGAQGDADGGI